MALDKRAKDDIVASKEEYEGPTVPTNDKKAPKSFPSVDRAISKWSIPWLNSASLSHFSVTNFSSYFIRLGKSYKVIN